ncbi:unnamed protein product [Amoebophrya sp. A25]|nr:unnamed protein product [Amoebophrya sp. A25]|eukprot:GSA25T00016317001.1
MKARCSRSRMCGAGASTCKCSRLSLQLQHLQNSHCWHWWSWITSGARIPMGKLCWESIFTVRRPAAKLWRSHITTFSNASLWAALWKKWSDVLPKASSSSKVRVNSGKRLVPAPPPLLPPLAGTRTSRAGGGAKKLTAAVFFVLLAMSRTMVLFLFTFSAVHARYLRGAVENNKVGKSKEQKEIQWDSTTSFLEITPCGCCKGCCSCEDASGGKESGQGSSTDQHAAELLAQPPPAAASGVLATTPVGQETTKEAAPDEADPNSPPKAPDEPDPNSPPKAPEEMGLIANPSRAGEPGSQSTPKAPPPTDEDKKESTGQHVPEGEEEVFSAPAPTDGDGNAQSESGAALSLSTEESSSVPASTALASGTGIGVSPTAPAAGDGNEAAPTASTDVRGDALQPIAAAVGHNDMAAPTPASAEDRREGFSASLDEFREQNEKQTPARAVEETKESAPAVSEGTKGDSADTASTDENKETAPAEMGLCAFGIGCWPSLEQKGVEGLPFHPKAAFLAEGGHEDEAALTPSTEEDSSADFSAPLEEGLLQPLTPSTDARIKAEREDRHAKEVEEARIEADREEAARKAEEDRAKAREERRMMDFEERAKKIQESISDMETLRGRYTADGMQKIRDAASRGISGSVFDDPDIETQLHNEFEELAHGTSTQGIIDGAKQVAAEELHDTPLAEGDRDGDAGTSGDAVFADAAAAWTQRRNELREKTEAIERRREEFARVVVAREKIDAFRAFVDADVAKALGKLTKLQGRSVVTGGGATPGEHGHQSDPFENGHQGDAEGESAVELLASATKAEEECRKRAEAAKNALADLNANEDPSMSPAPVLPFEECDELRTLRESVEAARRDAQGQLEAATEETSKRRSQLELQREVKEVEASLDTEIAKMQALEDSCGKLHTSTTSDGQSSSEDEHDIAVDVEQEKVGLGISQSSDNQHGTSSSSMTDKDKLLLSDVESCEKLQEGTSGEEAPPDVFLDAEASVKAWKELESKIATELGDEADDVASTNLQASSSSCQEKSQLLSTKIEVVKALRIAVKKAVEEREKKAGEAGKLREGFPNVEDGGTKGIEIDAFRNFIRVDVAKEVGKLKKLQGLDGSEKIEDNEATQAPGASEASKPMEDGQKNDGAEGHESASDILASAKSMEEECQKRAKAAQEAATAIAAEGPLNADVPGSSNAAAAFHEDCNELSTLRQSVESARRDAQRKIAARLNQRLVSLSEEFQKVKGLERAYETLNQSKGLLSQEGVVNLLRSLRPSEDSTSRAADGGGAADEYRKLVNEDSLRALEDASAKVIYSGAKAASSAPDDGIHVDEEWKLLKTAAEGFSDSGVKWNLLKTEADKAGDADLSLAAADLPPADGGAAGLSLADPATADLSELSLADMVSQCERKSKELAILLDKVRSLRSERVEADDANRGGVDPLAEVDQKAEHLRNLETEMKQRASEFAALNDEAFVDEYKKYKEKDKVEKDNSAGSLLTSVDSDVAKFKQSAESARTVLTALGHAGASSNPMANGGTEQDRDNALNLRAANTGTDTEQDGDDALKPFEEKLEALANLRESVAKYREDAKKDILQRGMELQMKEAEAAIHAETQMVTDLQAKCKKLTETNIMSMPKEEILTVFKESERAYQEYKELTSETSRDSIEAAKKSVSEKLNAVQAQSDGPTTSGAPDADHKGQAEDKITQRAQELRKQFEDVEGLQKEFTALEAAKTAADHFEKWAKALQSQVEEAAASIQTEMGKVREVKESCTTFLKNHVEGTDSDKKLYNALTCARDKCSEDEKRIYTIYENLVDDETAGKKVSGAKAAITKWQERQAEIQQHLPADSTDDVKSNWRKVLKEDAVACSQQANQLGREIEEVEKMRKQLKESHIVRLAKITKDVNRLIKSEDVLWLIKDATVDNHESQSMEQTTGSKIANAIRRRQTKTPEQLRDEYLEKAKTNAQNPCRELVSQARDAQTALSTKFTKSVVHYLENKCEILEYATIGQIQRRYDALPPIQISKAISGGLASSSAA